MIYYYKTNHGVTWSLDIRPCDQPVPLRTKISNFAKRYFSTLRWFLVKLIVGNRTCVMNANFENGTVNGSVNGGFFYRNMFNIKK